VFRPEAAESAARPGHGDSYVVEWPHTATATDIIDAVHRPNRRTALIFLLRLEPSHRVTRIPWLKP
jgi:hypothetical protein